MSDDRAVAARLRDLINETLLSTDQEPPDEPIEMNTFLPDMLDSITLTALIARIEEEWNLEISDEEIEPAIFETLDALSSFVEGRLTRL